MEFLKQLGLKAFNIGTSTGSNWLGDNNSEIINLDEYNTRSPIKHEVNK